MLKIKFLILFFIIPVTVCFAEEHTIDIPFKSNVFVPAKLTVNAGDVVIWVNNDGSIPVHMFASVPGSSSSETPEIEIVNLKAGESWEHTFKIPGRYPYFCFIHKSMTGEIIVK